MHMKSFCYSLSAAANNPDTVKTLKNVFDAFRTAAKTYSQVRCIAFSTSGSRTHVPRFSFCKTGASLEIKCGRDPLQVDIQLMTLVIIVPLSPVAVYYV